MYVCISDNHVRYEPHSVPTLQALYGYMQVNAKRLCMYVEISMRQVVGIISHNQCTAGLAGQHMHSVRAHRIYIAG
jgi:hypothetical protein